MRIKKQKLSKMATILKVVLCSLTIILFSSCSNQKEEMNIVDKLPKVETKSKQLVNIEDFRFDVVDDTTSFLKHQAALLELKYLDYFPSTIDNHSIDKISREIYEYYGIPYNESYKYTDKVFNNADYKDNHSTPYVECFISRKLIDESGKETYRLLLPRELDTLRRSTREQTMIKHSYGLIRKEIPLKVYCSLTGIPESYFKNLRVLSREQDGNSYYYYQMPYKDNYLDYQNDTKSVRNIGELKSFIRKGSILFISNSLDKGQGEFYVVNDKFIKFFQDGVSFKKYTKMKNKQNFSDINFLYEEMFNNDVSFNDYLKHFLLFKEDILNNKKNSSSTLKLIQGSNVELQRIIDKASCVAVINLNDGYNFTHPELINNVLKQLNTNIDKPIENGLSKKVIDCFLNNYEEPSLQLLLPRQVYKIKPTEVTKALFQSPFVKTRVWFKK